MLISCPKCRTRWNANAADAGRTITCRCGQVLDVPAPAPVTVSSAVLEEREERLPPRGSVRWRPMYVEVVRVPPVFNYVGWGLFVLLLLASVWLVFAGLMRFLTELARH